MGKLKSHLLKIRSCLRMTWYLLFLGRPGLKDGWILIDSKNGKDLGGNMLRIAQELTNDPAYKGYRVFLSYGMGRRREMSKMAAQYGLKGATLLLEGGFRYAKAAALARHLFTDTSFPLWFVKKEGQVIANTWHGTPLKKMGKDVGNRAYDMGNVQKSQLMADYLIYPSDYMRDTMASAYFLTDLYKGKILCSGYPRNSIFFRPEEGRRLKERLGLHGKRLYGYMPTWRGVLKKIDMEKNVGQIQRFLNEADEGLTEEEILFVRLHPFIQDTMDYSRYRRIRPFPKGYDPYDILNMCDCLATDYSSVMFDYAFSGRKIALFVFDKAAYMQERGAYASIDDFPFPQAQTVPELLGELRAPKEYDDGEFREKFCQYGDQDTAQKLCRHIVKGEKVYEEFQSPKNGKENVLIYSGDLSKNGLTTALLNLLGNIDLEKRNYYVTFRSALLQEEPERAGLLPEQVRLLPIAFTGGQSLGEALAIFLHFYGNVNASFVVKKADRYFKRLYRCSFGGYDFGHVIQYAGYERLMIHMFLQAPARRMIFVHNDMVREAAGKYRSSKSTFQRAYREYDRVVPVTEDICPPTMQLGGRKDNIRVVNNCHDYRAVLEKSRMELEFQKNTDCNVSIERLREILESKARKIITIGRFSPQKGHDMLLRAFDRSWKENPDSFLIIIGGYGELYEQTAAQAKALACADHTVIIRSMANPMPVLKKCDLFALSSLYEGLGLVLLEADTLGVPVISTDIAGPQGFLKEHGGFLTAPDEDGIYEGIRAFGEGRVRVMGVDYEAYNLRCVRQFEELFLP